MNHTLIIGTDFRRSSLKMRERVHFSDDIKPQVIRQILDIDGISECAILTTCNRVEIYFVCTGPSSASNRILKYLSRFHKVPVKMLKGKMYLYRCRDAVRHLFRVATGLESMVIGETQILGQIRDAYILAKGAGGTGPILNRLFQNALALGKKVRSVTPVSRGFTSIGSAAVALACEISDTASSKYGVIGAGTMGGIIARNLAKADPKGLYISNRSTETGLKLAEEVGGRFISLKDIDKMLSDLDLIITAASTSSHIISQTRLEKVLNNRSNLTIIDIATPGNVEPRTSGNIKGLALYTIDDLKDIIDRNIRLRKKSIKKIEDLINDKLKNFNKWYHMKADYGEATDNWKPGLRPRHRTVRYREAGA